MKKILVVYYSRTGTTKKVAELLSQKLGADLEEIKDTVNRSGIIGYLRSGRGGMKKLLTKLEPTTKNPVEYDLVVIGTPIWVNTSVPVRTYITEQKNNLKQVAFFCTMGGKSGDKAFAEMAEIIGQLPLSALALRAREVTGGEMEKPVTEFAEKLRN